nr:redoxin domain-containing protein [Gammaproteobacteria bacterium]
MSFYDYEVEKRNGEFLKLAELKGKVVVVVNTATGCGFTPQYKELEKLYEEYHDKGLEIIDIPCNQFYGQAPESDEEIHEFCSLKYKTQFDQMKKVEINGENEIPLYSFLKESQGFKGFKGLAAIPMKNLLKKIDPDYENNPEIKWNFTKFVIDKNGNCVARFEPTDSMKDLDKCVAKLI